MMKHTTALVAAAAAFALAACGGGSTGPTYATAVDSATASAAASDAAVFAGDVAHAIMNGSPNTGIGGFLPSKGLKATSYTDQLISNVRQEAYKRAHRTAPAGGFLAAAPKLSAPFSTCTPVVTGINPDSSAIDLDNDGIPDDLKITFPANCIESDTAGTVTTLFSGTIEMKDLAGFYAYRLNLGNLKIKYTETATGNFEQFAGNGFETATYASTGISHETNLTYGLSYYSATGGPTAPLTGPIAVSPMSGNLSFVYIEVSSYNPESAISLANPIPSGDLTFSFDYRILASSTGNPDQNFRFTMNTSTVLHFDTVSCSGITSGAVHGLLNGGSSAGFDITWTGCGAYTVTTFGTTEPTV